MWNKLSKHATTWTTDNHCGNVTYHHTTIVSWDSDNITLKSGGYNTVTTKRKMNQAAQQFHLGFQVWQENFEWFVKLPSGKVVDFEDGMVFERGIRQ